MKRMVLGLMVLSSFVWAQTPKFEYVGSNRCKACHNKAEEGGQYAQWESTDHAKAYETLLTDESKAIAKEMGLTVAPEKAPECLRCHVTGWGSPSGYKLDIPADDMRAKRANDNLAAVGCESCHGPGSEYKSKKIKDAIAAGEITKESVGLKNPAAEDCIVCHNEDSPTYKPFTWEAKYPAISHPYPEDME